MVHQLSTSFVNKTKYQFTVQKKKKKKKKKLWSIVNQTTIILHIQNLI